MKDAEYESAVEKYADAVYRAALSVCRNRADAEDVVQDTFLKLYTAEADFADEEHLRRWLIRVAVNDGKNRLKSAWRRNVCYLDELEHEPAQESEERELAQVIGTLPAKYSAAVHLYYYEGYSCAEIAEILGISESNVQTRLDRARKMLKKRLEDSR